MARKGCPTRIEPERGDGPEDIVVRLPAWLGTAEQVRACFTELSEARPGRRLVLDCRAVTSISPEAGRWLLWRLTRSSAETVAVEMPPTAPVVAPAHERVRARPRRGAA